MGNIKKHIILNYEITGDTAIIDKLFGVTEEIKQALLSMYPKVEKKKNSAVKELNDLIKKYPGIPQFKNLLSALYNKQGNAAKAYEVNHRIIAEHPAYLFGKLNLANEFISKMQFEKVPEILGELIEIKDLYPHRNVFHIDEVLAFYRTAVHYFISIENLEAAESRIEILKEINEDFDNNYSDDVEDLEESLSNYQLKKGLERYAKQREKAREVEVVPVKVVEQTLEKPIFTNEIIEQLYCNSMRITHDLLEQILQLPHETLISDLHKVVYDSMARYEYFAVETKWRPTTHEFLFHAMFLLTELKSEESLDVLLDILRQDEEYLDYWFSDSLTEEIWECYFMLGFKKLDKLKSFLFEPNHFCYARVLISGAVSQIALYYPERRDEIINWYKEVIKEIIERKDDENIIDTDWIGFIICDLLDIKAVELTLMVKQLFNEGLVSEDICGSEKDVFNELKTGRDAKIEKRETFDTIFSRYENIITSWHYYKDRSDLKLNDPNIDNNKNVNDEDDFNDYDDLKENLPITNLHKDIGRNDPCPCGSGKKYKKCCLKN